MSSKYILFILFAVLGIGCSKSADPTLSTGNGGGGGPVVQDDENVFLCRSNLAKQDSVTEINQCLNNLESSKKMAEHLLNIQFNQDFWLSITYQTKHFKSKYRLDDAKTNCLVEKFCKEKAI